MKRRTAGRVDAVVDPLQPSFLDRRTSNHNDNDDPFHYMEDYGDDDASSAKNRGLGGRVMSGPMICLWSCRRTFINPVIFCALAMVASFISMQFVDSILVMISSGMTIGIGLLVLFQRRKIKRLGTLRKQHNNLRQQANYFVQERERLHRSMERMDQKIASLSHVPKELERLSQKSSANYGRLVTIVEEQEDVQEAIRRKLRQRVIQSIMGVCVQADRNADFALSPSEIDVLVVRLKMIEGIEFHEERLRATLSQDSSIKYVLKVIRSLVEKEDEYELGDTVFRITAGSSSSKEKTDQKEEEKAIYVV